MTKVPESHRDLLEGRHVGVLATVGRDGFPQLTAVGFVLDDDEKVRVSVNSTKVKVANLRLEPKCALFVFDPSGPGRYLALKALATIEPDEGYVFLGRLLVGSGTPFEPGSRAPWDPPGSTRVVIELDPVSFFTWATPDDRAHVPQAADEA